MKSYDQLLLYQQCLPEGTTRRQIFDTYINRQRKRKRLPDQAKEVLSEIKGRLKDRIKETEFQRECRVDKEFDVLKQEGRPHYEFHAAWGLHHIISEKPTRL